MSDPTTFDVKVYTEAMTEALGPEEKTLEVIVKGFEIRVTYDFSIAVVVDQARTAIATAAFVLLEAVKVTIGRRLSDYRRLGSTVNARIMSTNAAAAKSVMTLTTNTASLKSELAKIGISAEVVLQEIPVVAVKLETKVTSKQESATVLPSTTKLAEVGSAIGGIITVTAVNSKPTLTETKNLSVDPGKTEGLPLWLTATLIGGGALLGIALLFFAIRCCCHYRKYRKYWKYWMNSEQAAQEKYEASTENGSPKALRENGSAIESAILLDSLEPHKSADAAVRDANPTLPADFFEVVEMDRVEELPGTRATPVMPVQMPSSFPSGTFHVDLDALIAEASDDIPVLWIGQGEKGCTSLGTGTGTTQSCVTGQSSGTGYCVSSFDSQVIGHAEDVEVIEVDAEPIHIVQEPAGQPPGSVPSPSGLCSPIHCCN